MVNDVYTNCSTYEGKLVVLRQTKHEDAFALLNCYSDVSAVPFFNSDNCHGDDFHYTTLQQMEKAIQFWDDSYKAKQFVRWSIFLRASSEIIGTIELFNRGDQGDGILRIDLQSNFEKTAIIDDVLELVDEALAPLFHVHCMITKAILIAHERRLSLYHHGYTKLTEDAFDYAHYFIKKINTSLKTY